MNIKSITSKTTRVAALGLITLSLAAWVTPTSVYKMAMDNEVITMIKKKLTKYNDALPEDRVYLHFDKPFYEPGESIWFSAYVRDGQTLKPSNKSDIVYVELLNPKGGIEKKLTIVSKNGKAAGDFLLDNEALGGMYKIRAYTNWMKNEGEENSFERDLQVQDIILPNLKMKLNFEKKAFGAGDQVVAKLELNTNENKPLSDYKIRFVANLNGKKIIEKAEVTDEEGIKFIKFNLPSKLETSDGLLNVLIDYNGSTESVSRSIPIILNDIDFTAFPEGGDLLCGFDNTVAFRALNEFGKPADIEGVVLDEKGVAITSFSSFHQGMGAFKINPLNKENYTIKITKPEGIKETFKLPEALKRGYSMSVDNSKEEEIAVNINSTENEELSLVAQVRGKSFYTTIIHAKKGSNKITFPTSNFPIGVCQITLFDSHSIPRSERLVFVNKDKHLSISVTTDKDKYLPREKVKMTLFVKDERGLPMPANLSMAVVNDQLLSFADDKSGNMLSQFLLQQDIKDKVEEPAFYFDDKEKKADKALDYLLMTSGWRRFTWEKLIENELPIATFKEEKAIVSGKVVDAYTGKVIANSALKINNGLEFAGDWEGKFFVKNLDLSKTQTITFKAPGYSDQAQYVQNYKQDMVVYLYPYQTYKYPSSKTTRSKSAKGSVVASQMDVEEMVPGNAAMMGAGIAELKMAGPVDFKNIRQDVAKKAKENQADKKAENKKDEAVNNINGGKILKAMDMEAEKMLESEVDDQREARFAKPARVNKNIGNNENLVQYYRARQFAAPVYKNEETVETRTDFRNTIYWNPNVEVGYSGKKTIEFYTSDDITSFRTTVEGVGTDGTIGRAEKNFFSQLPFAMTTKIPVEVATEDIVSIPLTLKNNTNKPLGGLLAINAPAALQAIVATPSIQTIMPGQAKTIYLDFKVLDKIGYGEFTIGFKACGLGDAFTQKIKIASKGFPVTSSFSGQDVEKEFSFTMNKVINGSAKAIFTAYPSVVNDLMKGVEGILREPGGCFEQTSMSAYPNAMVLDYLKATESKDDKTLAYAGTLLDRGYKRLVTFETKEKGYEWFGASPGHEGLTAFGLMEFVDMKKAGGNVDQKMIDRTAEWIMKHKDSKGGFSRNTNAYHDFGRISEDVMNAYIVYAVAEAGYTAIKNEFNASCKKALDTKDTYLIAMMANAAYSLKDTKKGDELLNALMVLQSKDGSWTGATHSITYSQGKSLTIETTAISIMAILKSGKNAAELNNAIQFLVSARSGYGVFSTTQGTVLALKALTEFAKASKKTSEDGTIELFVDGKKVRTKSYKAGDKGAIVLDSLENFISGDGKHSLKVKYVGVKTPLPYSVAVSWNTSLPNSNIECAVDLKTKLAEKSTNVGETVRLTATVTNKKNDGIPSTMVLLGIPAGFSVQPWQLKEMQEKHVFDYYEISGNNIAIYYRGMAPLSVKEINLDLKAEMPGEYDAPASSAYLYYTNEYKTWSSTEKITIKKTSI
ncbi:MAG: MG2 domain-containing protein [Bacteroidota bacterium]|nr:MG2 domain-containing protein [Bacteroidota bacterium]